MVFFLLKSLVVEKFREAKVVYLVFFVVVQTKTVFKGEHIFSSIILFLDSTRVALHHSHGKIIFIRLILSHQFIQYLKQADLAPVL